jgi:hypothetical protein
VKRARLIACAVLAAATLAACGVGAGDSQVGGATLTVTRDFGAERMLQAREDPIPGGETVLRFLTRKAKDVETRYGGRFVNAIDGVRSQADGGTRRDWFYFVNGIEADTGAAERDAEAGDRIWWDYRDWSAAMRVPAVVGSYPEPFLHGSEGKRFPVRLDCARDATEQCDAVRDRLDGAGVETAVAALGTAVGKDTLRVVVGEWADVRADAAVRKLEEGPGESGVFARPVQRGDAFDVALLDAKGRVARTLGPGSGLVAATRYKDQQPTWVVSGTDVAGVERAAALLDRSALRDRFAVAASGAPQAIPLPVGAGGE